VIGFLAATLIVHIFVDAFVKATKAPAHR